MGKGKKDEKGITHQSGLRASMKRQMAVKFHLLLKIYERITCSRANTISPNMRGSRISRNKVLN